MSKPTLAHLATLLLARPNVDVTSEDIEKAVATARVILKASQPSNIAHKARSQFDDALRLKTHLTLIAKQVVDLPASKIVPLVQEIYETELLDAGSLGRKLAALKRLFPTFLLKRCLNGLAYYTVNLAGRR